LSASRLTPAAAVRIVWALFAAGLLIAIVMLVRGQVAGDQLNLLSRGWLLAARGRWISYGNPMSTGGKSPGGITSLLVGLPLFLWRGNLYRIERPRDGEPEFSAWSPTLTRPADFHQPARFGTLELVDR